MGHDCVGRGVLDGNEDQKEMAQRFGIDGIHGSLSDRCRTSRRKGSQSPRYAYSRASSGLLEQRDLTVPIIHCKIDETQVGPIPTTSHTHTETSRVLLQRTSECVVVLRWPTVSVEETYKSNYGRPWRGLCGNDSKTSR